MPTDIVDDVYTVISALFGPDSGIPWWFWIAVVAALFFKIAIGAPRTAQEAAEDRDRALIAEIAGDGGKGKKGKKK